MVQFCGDLVVILIYSVQQKDYTTGQQESYLIYLKLMILSDVSRYDQWPTLQTSSSFFYKGYNYNASLPDSLSENILKCRLNGYSLRGRDLLTVPRFQTRYMKDSLKYRGAVLWYTVSYCKQEVGRSSLNNMKKAYSPETTLRNSNFTYFPLLLLALYRLIHTDFAFTQKL